MGPDFPTPEEERAIAAMIETDIDFSVENRHIHEVVSENLIDEDDE